MRDALDELPDPPDWVSPDHVSFDDAGDPSPAPNQPPATEGAEDSEPPPPRSVEPWRGPGWRPDRSLAQLASQILDTLDRVGDRIAEGLGLR